MIIALILACSTVPPSPPETTPSQRTVASVGGLPVCINEVMPANDAATFDADGEADDWIELHNPGDTDISLDGWSISDDRDDPTLHALPDGLVVPAGAFLVLWADGDADQGDNHLPFALSADGDEVALFDPTGAGTVLAFGRVHDDFSVARSTDCCTDTGCVGHDFRGTPGASNEPPPEPVLEEAFALGGTWAYLDDGGPIDADWVKPDFDDSAWATGPAPLGYGDDHIVTTVSYGPDSSNKYVTTWFRAQVELSDLDSVTAATLSLMRDDGAAVYFNGEEVFRSNMPTGDLTADTFASAPADIETATWDSDLDPALLIEGTNVIAAEVHQHAVTSSDQTFALSLTLSR